MLKPVITLLFLTTTPLGAHIPAPTPAADARVNGGYKPQRKVDGFEYSADKDKRDTTLDSVKNPPLLALAIGWG